ncbi:LysR family transcriptional regulator [Enterocloster lavalensis]|uniref:LysR family transcriptional regulator n=1 Tax=Enterocloster lavalensis TaxID=460384 RepID=UPI000D1AB8EF|nr:LysR family transcriptional regulator [Enterocloster lavalensis]PST32382.1 hypothetical protein C7256_15945 [Enterocloster lavalensis]
MTAEKLNYLIMLAEERNVTKAARRLFIAQPTLTTFINHLEKSLGVKLFDRSRNPVTITLAGKIYIEKMQRLLAEEQMISEELRRLEKEQQIIRIGIGQIHSELLIPEMVRKISGFYPDLNFTIREGQELNIMEWLKNDELDMIFGHMRIDNVNFEFQEICEEALCIVIPENLLRSAPSAVGQLDLDSNSASNPLMISPDVLSSLPRIEPASMQGLYLNLKSLLNQYHIYPPRIIQTSNMVTAATMIKYGLGYMYISPIVLNLAHVEGAERPVFCRLPQMQESRKYYVAYKRHNPNTAIIQKVIEVMKEIAV